MENTFEYLQAQCKAAGTNLSKVCDKAGIRKSTVWGWKNNQPLQITILRRLEEAIAAESQTKKKA